LEKKFLKQVLFQKFLSFRKNLKVLFSGQYYLSGEIRRGRNGCTEVLEFSL